VENQPKLFKRQTANILVMNRRAMGALTCTCVLIGFSMILGLMFMSWGKSYIEERAEFVVGVAGVSAGCVDIDLRFIEVNRVPQVCHAGNKRIVMVENVGNTMISNMDARVVDSGAGGVTTLDQVLDSPIPIGQSRQITLTMSPPAKQAKLTPMIVVRGKKEFCFDKALSVDGPFSAC